MSTFMRFYRRVAIVIVSVLIFSVFSTTTVQAQNNLIAYTFVSTSGCDEADLIFNAVYVFPETQTVYVRTILEAAGDVYTDSILAGTVNAGVQTALVSITESNTGGTQTANFPLPPDTPILVTFTAMDELQVPMWQTTILLSKCNAGSVFSHQTGSVTQLLLNEGFEAQSGTPAQAAKWKYNVDDDKRVCDGTVLVSHTGNCAFRFKGKNNVTTNISQVYNYKPVGDNGDQVALQAYIYGTNLAPGSTIRATIKPKNQPNKNVKINIPEGGQLGYVPITSAPVDIQEPIKSVNFRITKVGKGTLLIDNVALLLAQNATPPSLLTLPATPDTTLTPTIFDGLRDPN